MAQAPMSLYVQGSGTSTKLQIDMNETAMRHTDEEIEIVNNKEAENGTSSEEVEEMRVMGCKKSGGMKAKGACRGKVEIKRIENTASRQVTFSKRRNGLLKKAFELSVLCDSQLALIIVSATNKLYEFASPNMGSVLERYQRSLNLSQSGGNAKHDLEYWRLEANKTKELVVQLEEKHRNFMGENLMGFQVKDLQRIENQISTGMARIRERKIQLLRDQVESLTKKEHMLMDENKMLRSQINGRAWTQEKITRERQHSHHSHQESKEQERRVISIETNLQLACPRG